MPVTEILSSKIPSNIYQGFYVYLYLGSIGFVFFQYATNCRKRAVFNLLKSYRKFFCCFLLILFGAPGGHLAWRQIQ